MNNFNDELERLMRTLEGLEPDSPQYKGILESFLKLESARMKREEQARASDKLWRGMDRDNMLKAGLAFGSTLLVLNFERLNIVTSRAFGKFFT